nr:hypothetical protein [Acidiferrobacterales bacterium]
VPNSPINRYHQVEDSIIENNTLINVDHIQLGAGSDPERSAVPVRTTFKQNLIYNEDKRDTFTVYDDVSGISFAKNRINDVKDPILKDGFVNQPLSVERGNDGLMRVTLSEDSSELAAGLKGELAPITKQDVGTQWYTKSDRRSKFGFGKIVEVKPGQDSLTKAVKAASDGDVLMLTAGAYPVSKVINLDKGLVIKRAQTKGARKKEESVEQVLVTFERGALFEIQQGGSLKIDGLTISGVDAPDSSGNTVVRTPRRSMLSNYELIVIDSKIVDLDVNHSFNFLTVAKGTFADRIALIDSSFANISGAILKLDQENDDFGIYNAEYVDIENSNFKDVRGAIVDLYRGGTDESTFGPHLNVSNSVLSNVGKGKRNKTKSSMRLHGVQVATITNSKFEDSAGISVAHTVAEPITKVANNLFKNTAGPTVVELNSDKTNTATIVDNTAE